jgi:aminoglycoside 2''-phosphotransferase
MDAEDARGALLSAGAFVDPVVVGPVGDGWSAWTFEVDGEWIVRFPRTAEVAARYETEAALLREVAPSVSFGVPDPTVGGMFDGRGFHGYRKLPGDPMTMETFDADAVAAVLRELHGFPVERARSALGIEGTVDEWRAVYVDLRDQVRVRLAPRMEPDLLSEVEHGFELFLAGRWWPDPVLVHHDLGLEHVLVGPDGISLIDFEYAKVGDPAADFIGLWIGLGLDAARATIRSYGPTDPGFPGRCRFYRWTGSVWAALHGLETADDALVEDALSETRRRIESAGDLLDL